ncbi:MAG: zf-TFIIB domain-containing protein [Synechococcales cyanobacterium RM1_1_8]|nr:zf-TFIIB domain-containing protein [Synechococcales cyanobacterium RM1_1_8]
MLCPKDRKTPLIDTCLTEGLNTKHCTDCKGTWLPAAEYKVWQKRQPEGELDPARLSAPLDVEFVQAPYDTRAALCPECGAYLARARVNWRPAFYVERCPACEGIWCDHGEWAVLEKLGFHRSIHTLFSKDWQVRVRKQQLIDQERQAIIEKLGPELAEKIFILTAELEEHPKGDFGVAYLMRRFENVRNDASASDPY